MKIYKDEGKAPLRAQAEKGLCNMAPHRPKHQRTIGVSLICQVALLRFAYHEVDTIRFDNKLSENNVENGCVPKS